MCDRRPHGYPVLISKKLSGFVEHWRQTLQNETKPFQG